MTFLGLSMKGYILAICIVILFIVLLTWANTMNSTTPAINSLNATDPDAGGGLRTLYRMSFSGAGTKTLRVNVPNNGCTIAFNYSMLPTATAIDATIDIGTTSTDTDFGTESIVAKDYDEVGGYGSITSTGGTAAIDDICSVNGTAQLFITVDVTSTTPVTFLFEQVSVGYGSFLSNV